MKILLTPNVALQKGRTFRKSGYYDLRISVNIKTLFNIILNFTSGSGSSSREEGIEQLWCRTGPDAQMI